MARRWFNAVERMKMGSTPSHGQSGKGNGADGNASRIIAAGHFRNGILLSAVTADAVAALLNGDKPHQAWAPFHPGRFQKIREITAGPSPSTETRATSPQARPSRTS